MDQMEVEEVSEPKSQVSNRISQVESLWSVIHMPVIAMFPDLKKPGTEQSLRVFLESMTRSTDTINNILIPPYRKGERYEILKRQYAAFATWLFGTLFHTLGASMSKETIQISIEVQAYMLKILYRSHFTGFHAIYGEYITILDQIFDYYDNANEETSIEINQFIFDPNVFETLDLKSYPLTVRKDTAYDIINSIVKIFLKSGAMLSNQNILWWRILKVLKLCEPEAKLVAMKVASKMITSNYINEKQFALYISYTTEILKTINHWQNMRLLSPKIIEKFSEVIAVTLENVICTAEIIDICFDVIELVADKIIVSKKLEIIACDIIRNYLSKFPRCYNDKELIMFTKYFVHCPNFIRVLAHFIAFDIKPFLHTNVILNITKLSQLWKSIMDIVMKSMDSPDFIIFFKRVLDISRLLSSWLSLEKSRGRFFNDFHNLLQNFLIKIEASNNMDSTSASTFMYFVDILALNEDDSCQNDIQNILLLPWSQAREPVSMCDEKTYNKLTVMAKSLDTDSKIKCLETVCKLGKGRIRMKYLSSCIANSHTEFSTVVLLNSIFLLKDPEIKFFDINTHILKPALITQRKVLEEALTQIIGPIICQLSGMATITKTNWDDEEWHVNCSICDNDEMKKFSEQTLSNEIETLFHPYFQLFTSKHEETRKNMIQNLKRFSNHISAFNTNNILKCWLPLIRDPVVETRKHMANSIETIVRNKIHLTLSPESRDGDINTVQDNVPEDLKIFIEIIMQQLTHTLKEVLKDKNDSVHKTLLMMVRGFARVPIHFIERRVCNILIISVLHLNSTPISVALATDVYHEIAELNKITPRELFTRYKKEIIELMIRTAAKNSYEVQMNLASSLHKAANCIGYRGTRDFFLKNGNIAIIYLVPLVVQAPVIQNLLNDFAYIMESNLKRQLLEYFQYICPHVLINETPQVAVKSLFLIAQKTDTSLDILISRSFLGIFRELLIYFHEKMERVIICLNTISKFDVNLKNKTIIYIDSAEKLANYLKPQLHAVLVNFDSNLSTTSSDEYTQQCALASLATLIKFMGTHHLSPLKYKILSTLRKSLGFTRPGFRKLACYAWDSFIRNVAVKELGPLLSTICVSLIPLLECFPVEANSMLEYLLIDNNALLSNYISELFFIKDLKVFPRILNNVLPQTKRSVATNNFAENLELWQRRILHEMDEVRLKALVHLQKFLEQHRSELNKLILNDTNHVHPAIVQLLDALLNGCQHTNEEIRLYSGECLGELGGIEPSLLPRRIVSRSDSKFIPEMNSDFACDLLFELIRAFQMLNTTLNVDCFSLAIQEVSRTYDIIPDGVNRLWKTLPLMTQQIILPFLTSHYKPSPTSEILQYPIYGTQAGSTFETWIYSWACCMILSIKEQKLARMFNACRPAFKRDVRTAIFCIPYIVIYCIINGNDDDRDGLIKEILCVIRMNDEKLDNDLMKTRPLHNVLHNIGQKPNEIREISDETRQMRCAQMIFVTLDYIKRWIEEKRLDKNSKYMAVENFLSRLDPVILAEGCYQSHEYHRALMYLERHMASKNTGIMDSTESGLLTKIYTQLEEPDGVSGILALQDQSPTLQQHVLAHEISGQLQDAATCYERLAQRHGTPKYLQGMIQCYLGLEQPFTATNITKGVLDARPELKSLLIEHEPFWRLAHFVHLDVNDNTNVNTTIKRSIIDNLTNKISPDIQGIKKKLVSFVGAATHQVYAYQQNYPYIMRLHAINEFEKAIKLILKDIYTLPELLNEWEQRGQLVRGSRGVELVLGMRRAALDLGVQIEKNKINNNQDINMMEASEQQPFFRVLQQEIGKIWLRSARIARKAGLHQQAYMYILSARDYCPSQELNIEQAQLYWQRDCQKDAFITLRRLFSTDFQPLNYYKNLSSDICTIERKLFAKAKLLFATYNDKTVNVDTEINKRYYKEAVDAWRCWEKSYLACAQYHDMMFDRMGEDKRDIDNGLAMQLTIITNYAKSLLYGCKFIHQSMPRMLTIWMNFALRVHSNRNPLPSQTDMMLKLTRTIEIYVGRLPKFMWLTVFSQLVSRICHPAKEVQSVLNTILVNLILSYPQYCLWMMASVINSSYQVRQTRCQSIMNMIKRNMKPDTNNIIYLMKDFQRLWQCLIDLSNKQIPDKVQTTSVSLLSSKIKLLLASSSFGPIMMPTSKFCQLHLPQSVKGTHTTTLDRHNPFITEWVSIKGIAEQVVVLASLQRPRRITLLGSDGNQYLFMCKPRDDLRRDFRLMEFNDIVNKYLQKDPESRQRRLYIRTYGVVPLNEECGLIEWIPNLIGYRIAIINLYKERGIAVSNREILSIIPSLSDSLEKKRHIFLKKLLPRHPPIWGNWFTLNFPDSYGWYEARTAYIRTTAVMSMVGYILGLGDRHGDNILFDSKSGDCVHVDFNCLFNRGETFQWPERVPFRLTHNMVDAMGPLKYEGPFRKSCEITMRILRQETSTLISVLTPFVYDPLVSWTKNQHVNDAAEKTNEKAVQNIKDIELRLKGFVRSIGSQIDSTAVNLSVEGQTNHLILEATNIDNLCQMYQGWSAFI
ncbi:hypothetical protein PV325_010836 [Microctonus aethiopoides]|uniref:Serine/threonine-protein kinase ATR n=1 Tax=Microctonus aethiopoides TaxID=144406 RepID=A0AA39KLZ9_9HYME|nr:hypothetical protein PV325_010836 [Microctonus aethiopoides]KAK0166448.1 hypothetical protein PV328_004868 [Microctonus aethiopoides]